MLHFLSISYLLTEAIIGFSNTTLRVNEDAGVVEICATVLEPNVTSPIEFEFSVLFNTSSGINGILCYIRLYVCVH